MADKSHEAEEAKPEGAEDAEGLDAPKKSGIKKLLIIIVPLVLLIGGGAGAYFTGMLDGVLGKKTEATANAGEKGGEHGAAASEGEHGGGGKEGEKGGEHGAAGGPTFIKVADEKGQDMVVNLNSGDGQMRFLQLGVQLELESAADADRIKAVMPRVIDQFQTYLRELRIKDLRGSAGIYRLQMELLARVNQAAAPVHVKDVLFEKILIQ